MRAYRVPTAVAAAVLAFTGAALAEGGGKARKPVKTVSPPAPPPVVAVAPAPPPIQLPAVPIWQGLYAGVSGGYGWGRSEQSYDRNDNHGLAATHPEGVLASLTVGHNHLVTPGFLVGVEADLGLMDITADDKVVYDGHVYKTSFGPWWGTMRARAGVVVDRTLLYGTGGVAFMGVDEVSIGNTPGETAHNKDTRSGWVIGGGIEHALAPGVSAKVEYLHMDFGKYEGLSANREDFSFDNKVDLVRTGLSVRF
jgi:outer membrane immunogenic protein